jgi:hypothetical protein
MGKILSYSISTIKPDKTPAIWVVREPNIAAPICYLRRPKWLNDAQWNAVLDSIVLKATPDLLEAVEP